MTTLAFLAAAAWRREPRSTRAHSSMLELIALAAFYGLLFLFVADVVGS